MDNTQNNSIQKSDLLHVEELPLQFGELFFFHPLKVGDIYNERYKVIRKLGNGTYFSCWLSEDLRS
jgi:serine/threonine-protein kinase SRPK3